MTAATALFDSEDSSATMRFGRLGELYVALHPSVDPAGEDWLAMLDDLKRELPSVRGVFVYTMGGGPNADQRRRLAEVYAANPGVSLLAVVTPSAAVKAIVTAINWFVRHAFKMFSPEHLDDAFGHLRASSTEQAAIRELLQRHAKWMGLGPAARKP